MIPDVESVTQWAELADRFGAIMIVAVVLGLFFLLIAMIMFRHLLGQVADQERARALREKAIDDERKQLVGRVLSITDASTIAIHAATESIRDLSRELVEFRRDTHSSAKSVERLLDAQTQLIERRSEESRASHELTRTQIAEVEERLSHIEGNYQQARREASGS